MATTLVRRVMLKITSDDGDTELKLSRIAAKAEELGRLHPDLQVKINSAAASAKLAVLRKELKDTGKAASGDSQSLKGRLKSLGEGLALAGGFATFSKDAGTATKVMSGFSLATGLLEAPMAGAIVGVAGLASGLVAAGAGLLAFGAVAKSNYTTASTAANAVQTAQITYNAALKAGAKQSTAYIAEQKAIGIAYAQLSPAQITLSRQIGNAKNSWQSFVQSNTSGVAKIMTQGIGLLPKVFASMQPFMKPTETALHGLIGQMGKGLNSSGFKSFTDMLAKNSGPAITKLGQAIGHIVVGLGGIIRAFMPFAQIMLSGLDKITAKFAHWGSTLTSHSGFQSLVTMAKTDMPYVIGIVKNLGGAIKNLGGSMTGLSTFSNSKMLLQMVLPLSQILNTLTRANPALTRFALYALAAGDAVKKIRPAVTGISGVVKGITEGTSALGKLKGGFTSAETAASDASGVWGTAGGKLSTMVTAVKSWGIWSKIAAGATKIWTGIQAAFDVVMDANPIGIIVIAIVALIGVIVLITMHSKTLQRFWKAAWKDISAVAVGAWHLIDANMVRPLMRGVDNLVGFVKRNWKMLATIIATVLLGPIAGIVVYVATHWTQVKTLTGRLVRDVRSVLDWFGHLGSLFRGWWDDGVRAVEGAAGRLVSFVRGIPGKILGALGNLGNMLFSAGKKIVGGLISGIGSMIGSVGSAIGGIAGEITSHLPFSPAKKGPLSGAGSPDLAGRRIGLMLAAGMTSSAGMVHAAAARVAGAARVTAGGGGPGGAAGGVVRLEWDGAGGDAEIFTYLKKHIRIRGGDPAVLGR